MGNDARRFRCNWQNFTRPSQIQRELRLRIANRELWASALQVQKQHAEGANLFVAERIGALALAGDEAGIAIWKEIARRLDMLRDETQPRQ